MSDHPIHLQDAPRTLRSAFKVADSNDPSKQVFVVYASFAVCLEREANSLRAKLEPDLRTLGEICLGLPASKKVPTPEYVGSEESAIVKHAMEWYRWTLESGQSADDFGGPSRAEWLACKALSERGISNPEGTK